jgi:hypothetical protein
MIETVVSMQRSKDLCQFTHCVARSIRFDDRGAAILRPLIFHILSALLLELSLLGLLEPLGGGFTSTGQH